MRPAVRAAFYAFNDVLEGHLPYMYLDNEGLVTTGVGDLVDPMTLALTLPWMHKFDGSPATRQEVITEWLRVKALQAHKDDGGGEPVFRDSARLVLTEGGINTVVQQRLDLTDAYLTRSFPGYLTWPADAELGLVSMAWAMGSAFRPKFPRFAAAVDQLDFATAAGLPGDAARVVEFRGQSWMNDAHNPGLRKRNLRNKILFQNAAIVIRDGLDLDVLHWPTALQG